MGVAPPKAGATGSTGCTCATPGCCGCPRIGPHLEHRILAFALGHPGFGPRRISAELRRPGGAGSRSRTRRLARVLKRFKPPAASANADRAPRRPLRDCPEQTPKVFDAQLPGEKVQASSRLTGSKGDLAVHRDRRHLRHVGGARARQSIRCYTAELAHLVATELKHAGESPRSPPTTAPNFAPRSSSRRSPSTARGSARSKPADPTQTAAPNASS